MSDGWLALTWVAVVVAIGAVVAVALLARSRTVDARVRAEGDGRYRELAERCQASQQHAAGELARMAERLAAVEKLLREVG